MNKCKIFVSYDFPQWTLYNCIAPSTLWYCSHRLFSVTSYVHNSRLNKFRLFRRYCSPAAPITSLPIKKKNATFHVWHCFYLAVCLFTTESTFVCWLRAYTDWAIKFHCTFNLHALIVKNVFSKYIHKNRRQKLIHTSTFFLQLICCISI